MVTRLKQAGQAGDLHELLSNMTAGIIYVQGIQFSLEG